MIFMVGGACNPLFMKLLQKLPVAVSGIEADYVRRWEHATRGLLGSSGEGEDISHGVNYDGNNPYPVVVNGTHSVQVLTTYTGGENNHFAIWNAYLHAIKTAEHYIYIEDQYLDFAGQQHVLLIIYQKKKQILSTNLARQ